MLGWNNVLLKENIYWINKLHDKIDKIIKIYKSFQRTQKIDLMSEDGSFILVIQSGNFRYDADNIFYLNYDNHFLTYEIKKNHK